MPSVQDNTLANNPALYAVEQITHTAQLMSNSDSSEHNQSKQRFKSKHCMSFWKCCFSDSSKNDAIPLLSHTPISSDEREAIFLLKRGLEALVLMDKKVNNEKTVIPRTVLAHERARDTIALIQNTLASKEIKTYASCLNAIITTLGEKHGCITTYEAHKGYGIN